MNKTTWNKTIALRGFAFVFAAALGSTTSERNAGSAPSDFAVTSAQGGPAYDINGQLNPRLTLTRARTYTFALAAPGHPFWIKTVKEAGAGDAFATGVTNNGFAEGTVTFTVPASAPATLYYQCQYHDPMGGMLSIVSAAPAVPATTGTGIAVAGAGLALFGFLARRRRPPLDASR